MEYAKDIILNLGYKKEKSTKKMSKWTSNIFAFISRNKIIIITLSILVILISIDFILINSFLEILSKM